MNRTRKEIDEEKRPFSMLITRTTGKSLLRKRGGNRRQKKRMPKITKRVGVPPGGRGTKGNHYKSQNWKKIGGNGEYAPNLAGAR